ncbi:MAG: hypothetical protein H6R00_400 [Proteobacteria bacterium]|nr:hypothetical protein [Pseudomonadota bacterium]
MARLAALITAAGTHIYVDTSFLMWMTKIGSESRRQLISWLQTNCNGRVHVPIWAAHEYLKHHVAGTIANELAEKTSEVADLVGRTYSYFRPFIDEPYGEGAEDPAAIRAATRAALNALERLVSTSRQWHKSYQKHANEVIAFINDTSPETTTIYDYFPQLGTLGAGRFVGSIPPGFQDRRKKGASADGDANSSEDGLAGSNRYGDLVFWKELLDHARLAGAAAVIVLTNDRKNDWHLGRSHTVDIDASLLALRKTWKPVPRTHPMLVVEAKQAANIDQVELLDSPYLAALLRGVAENEVRAFADVAIIPDGPEAETERARRAKTIEERLSADAMKIVTAAAENGYLFPDGAVVSNSPAAFRRALFESRTAVGERGEALLEEVRASVEARQPLRDIITQDKLDGLDHKELTRIARELHDRVVRAEPGFGEALTDMLSLLDILPENTAGCFYLGFLSSMYLERETNASRLPPVSPVAQLLFASQAKPYAANAVANVRRRLADNDRTPLYLPSVDLPPVSAVLDIESDSPGLDQLRSLRIAGVEVLTAAQQDEALRLSTLFDLDRSISGDAIVRKACELFALPTEQIELPDAFAQTYSLTETIGFKRPVDVAIPKEQSVAG